MPDQLPHLKFDSFHSTNKYVYPKEMGGKPKLATRNRAMHGNRLVQQLNAVKDQFEINRQEPLPQNIVRDDAIYVEFTSEVNFPLKFESLTQEADDPTYQILQIKKEIIPVAGSEDQERFKVVVMMKEGAVSNFLKKVNKYLTRNTRKDRPRNENLIANIQNIELATLRSFWTDEPEIPFPDTAEVIWWEVWFRKTTKDTNRIDRVLQNLQNIGAQVGEQTLQFPEHTVQLIKASAEQLSQSLVLLDNLAELRKPQQLNDFITSRNIDITEKNDWVADLLQRLQSEPGNNPVAICILDSGINNKHPLLAPFLPDNRLYTFKTSWGTEDSWEDGGHGTGMGGLSLYGDLVHALATTGNISIFHSLESVKIIHPRDPSDPAVYGAITQYACYTPVVDAPETPRVYCLAITDKSRAFNGRPSNWSAAIDKIAFGDDDHEPQLFIVSGGNAVYDLSLHDASHYPALNDMESIHDPAQSYNALTVGSYTRMDRIDQQTWPGHTPLAANGGMSPSNSTSILWDNQWPVKPDIVMEGGNWAVQGTALIDGVHTLKPLSLDKDFANYVFMPMGDTSGAAALASRMAAELKTHYPTFWPETIRGLMVHSAQWTDVMLNGLILATANVNQKRNLLRTFGYGVPNLERAKYSADNVMTLIAENLLQPYQLSNGNIKYNDYHLYKIPWPVDILQEYLADKDVKITLTLSYFIDPNPGNKRYARNFSYYSHSLDFKMIRPTETLDEFKRRASGAPENTGTAFNGQEEPWTLKESARNRGSIKKDFLVCSGADLATRNYIAVYPKNGWYYSREKMGKADARVRYSLIISIESEELTADIYNPVLEMIAAELSNELPI